MTRKEICSILEQCELFKGLPQEDIEKIAGSGRLCSYETGETLFQQGDFGANLYVIADGQVSLERTMDLGSRKGNVVISILGRGRALGCWSTMLDESHHLMSSACCRHPTRVVEIPGDELRTLMVATPRMGFRVMENLCFVLRDRIQGAYGALDKV